MSLSQIHGAKSRVNDAKRVPEPYAVDPQQIKEAAHMRRIQAYFKTEDNAESAKTSLISTDAKVLDMGPLEAPLGKDHVIVAIPVVGTTNGTGVATSGSEAPVSTVGVVNDGITNNDDDSDQYTYAATIETSESDLHKVFNILANNDGKIKPFDDELNFV